MGMTELVMAVSLKKDTPETIIDILEFMVGDREKPPINLPDHPLFQTKRWAIMLQFDSAYFAGDTLSTLTANYIGYCLTVRCNLKNYDSEIEWFIDWISPYIDNTYDGFLGYMRYEECDDPTLIYFDSYNKGYPIRLIQVFREERILRERTIE